MDTHQWVYQALGRNTESVEIACIDEKKLATVFAFFPKMRNLKLDGLELKDLSNVTAYPRLESLTLNDIRVDKKYLVKLFKHLDATLHKLDFSGDVPKALETLHNLRELHMCNKSLIRDMSPFFKQNKRLERIFIGETDAFGYKEEKRFKKMCDHNKVHIKANYKAMAALPQLRLLWLRLYMLSDGGGLWGVKFPELRELNLWTYKAKHTINFLKNVGVQLKVFRTSWEDWKVYDPMGLARFPQLEHVEVREDMFTEEDLFPLKQLKTLKVCHEQPATVLKLVKELPLLRDITVGDVSKWTFDKKLDEELLKVLRAGSGREIRMNGSEFLNRRLLRLKLFDLLFCFRNLEVRLAGWSEDLLLNTCGCVYNYYYYQLIVVMLLLVPLWYLCCF